MKDRLDKFMKSNVIYSIKFSKCPDKCYIGVTTQMLEQRISKHRSDCNTNRVSCALAQHVHNKNHQFDFDNADILAQHNSEERLKVLEKLYIKSSNNCVNKKSIEAADISLIYSHLFNFLAHSSNTTTNQTQQHNNSPN